MPENTFLKIKLFYSASFNQVKLWNKGNTKQKTEPREIDIICCHLKIITVGLRTLIIFCKLSEYIPTSTRSMYLFYLLSLISLETSISYNFLLSLPHTISRKHKDDTMGEGRRVPCPLYLMGVVANGLIQPEMQRTHFNEFMLIFLTRKIYIYIVICRQMSQTF